MALKYSMVVVLKLSHTLLLTICSLPLSVGTTCLLRVKCSPCYVQVLVPAPMEILQQKKQLSTWLNTGTPVL